MTSPEMPIITYFPTDGIAFTPYRGHKKSPKQPVGVRVASRPPTPQTLPSAIAIIIVPMTIVQTICEEEKYGASSRFAPISTAISDIPAKNPAAYKKNRLLRADAGFVVGVILVFYRLYETKLVLMGFSWNGDVCEVTRSGQRSVRTERSAIAIIIVPMTIVQTICEGGKIRREQPVRSDLDRHKRRPAKNRLRKKNRLLGRTQVFVVGVILVLPFI